MKTPASEADREFVIARTFPAPRALLWRLWTEPAHLTRWWGPGGFTNPVCEFTPTPGAPYRITMRSADGVDFPLKGIVREAQPPDRLVLTMDASEHPPEWHDLLKPNRDKSDPNPAGEMLQTVTFADAAGGTLVTVRTRFVSTAVREAMVRTGMNEGWSASLDRLGAEVQSSLAGRAGLGN